MIRKFLYSQKVAPYVFVLPFILVFLIFWVYPLGSSLGMSFQQIQLGQEAEWVGISNYDKLLGDGIFMKAVLNSAVYMVLTLVILIPFPMLFAVLINHKFMWGESSSNPPSSSRRLPRLLWQARSSDSCLARWRVR